MRERVQERLDKIDQYYYAASPDVREKADELIPWGTISELDDDTSFLQFERRRVAEIHEDRNTEGGRTDPLCECSDRACPPKRGELPPQCVPRRGGIPENRKSALERARHYIASDHPDVVIAEIYDEWQQRYPGVLPDLTRAAGLLEQDVEQDRGLVDV